MPDPHPSVRCTQELERERKSLRVCRMRNGYLRHRRRQTHATHNLARVGMRARTKLVQ